MVDERVAALVARGVVPIKPEFLRAAADARVVVPPLPSNEEPAAVLQKKSKNQMKRERKQQHAAGGENSICFNFVRGCCSFSNNCRFGHDIQAYLRRRRPDLPGRCPFSEAAECPYGILCRWASTHGPLGGEAAGPTAAAAGTDVELVLGLGSEGAAGARKAPDGSIPEGVVALPPPGSTAAPLNQLNKQVQALLRRSQYDFSTANAALTACGAKAARAEAVAAHAEGRLRPAEKHRLDLRGKLYLAPLTTVGNLPFRRVCKGLGADVTCGEMALATNLLQGQGSEWALFKRDPCEDLFGVQICGGYPDALAHCAQLVEEHVSVDFVDINMGCPIDLICNKNAGSSLLTKPARVEQIVRSVSSVLSCPLTFKVRKGYNDGADIVHTWLPRAASWGAAAATIHGRTRQQRYSKLADWEYIRECVQATAGALPLVGNGDVTSFEDFYAHMEAAPELATIMLARGALIKPWIFTEIKERRHWDISARERLDLLKAFCAAGVTHWGSDSRGVETTRRFLLEWMSFLCRYVPVGLLEVLPQRLNWRPPAFVGRSDLETWLASENPADWLRISEMLLGRAPAGFKFAPKHKSNSYSASEGSMAFEGADNG
ncbi:hypothetical protein WJX81_002201 [Elliptochloris bilobata]|uniref:tRNA-dihydrouridine(47) synthase [NAD(P)(+)] n=1 Tax=Elliptochloris bilobata TaxID=381761 RepID=A0AAW1RG49_9CHLO